MPPLTRHQVRDIDRRAVSEFGMPSFALMENAGRGAAHILMQLKRDISPTTILCGKGNNGGDGFVMGRWLDLAGVPVTIITTATDELTGDARIAFDIARNAGMTMKPWDASMGLTSSWIVDALLGTGLTGPARPPFDEIIDRINHCGAKVLAVDLPSGLDCDSGEPLGPTVKADHTVTFVAPKAGFASPLSLPWTGEVHVVPIGVPHKLLEEFGLPRDESWMH